MDNKQMFKVADICQVRPALPCRTFALFNVVSQMLLVEDKIPNEEALSSRGGFNIDEFIYPHGITPPLKHVRKRRFRKRVNRRVRCPPFTCVMVTLD